MSLKTVSDSIIEKTNTRVILIASFIISIVAFQIVGIIPVNGGLGWDGERYFALASNVFSQNWNNEDPYRAIRLSAFPVLIFLKKLNLSTDIIIYIQAIINAVILSLACAALYKTMLNINISKGRAVLGTWFMLFTWPSLVMTTFYPILTDHAALALSCFALLAWTRKNNIALYAILFYSIWVMPSMIIVPFILICLPLSSSNAHKNIISTQLMTKIAIFLAIATVAIYLYKVYSLNILSIVEDRVTNFLRNKTSLTTSIKWLYPVSIVACSAMLAIIILKTTSILNNIYLWKSIQWKSFFLATATSLISLLSMFFILDFNTGFTGPSLLQNMLAQSIAAPFKSIVSHFFYFGPFLIFTYLSFFKSKTQNIPLALLLISFAYMPLLALGSESRQWIMILPPAIICGMYFRFSYMTGLIFFICSWLLLTPSITLNNEINQAIKANDGFQDYTWQHYFAYQGPWLNTGIYTLGFILLILLILSIFFTEKNDKKRRG